MYHSLGDSQLIVHVAQHREREKKKGGGAGAYFRWPPAKSTTLGSIMCSTFVELTIPNAGDLEFHGFFRRRRKLLAGAWTTTGSAVSAAWVSTGRIAAVCAMSPGVTFAVSVSVAVALVLAAAAAASASARQCAVVESVELDELDELMRWGVGATSADAMDSNCAAWAV